MKKRIMRKEFFITLFLKQNNHHRYGVLGHTLKLFWLVLKDSHYNMLAAALLHDIGKPLIAYQDEKDKTTGEYSFHNHEELSYQLIKSWKSISPTTKFLVRFHYMIRGMQKAKEKNQLGKYNRMQRMWDRLTNEEKEKIALFMRYDDMAKK
jgi:predicted HD phosphohydrolase